MGDQGDKGRGGRRGFWRRVTADEGTAACEGLSQRGTAGERRREGVGGSGLDRGADEGWCDAL